MSLDEAYQSIKSNIVMLFFLLDQRQPTAKTEPELQGGETTTS
jgi:hypothetical protein